MHKTGINRIKCDFRGMAMFSVEGVGVGVGVEGVETGINRIKRDFRRMAMFLLEGGGGGGGERGGGGVTTMSKLILSLLKGFTLKRKNAFALPTNSFRLV